MLFLSETWNGFLQVGIAARSIDAPKGQLVERMEEIMEIHPLVDVEQSTGNSSTSGESACALMEGMQGALIAVSPLA